MHNTHDFLTKGGFATLFNDAIISATTTEPTYNFDQSLQAYLFGGIKGAQNGVYSQIKKVSLEITNYTAGSFKLLIRESKDNVTYNDVDDNNLWAYDYTGSPTETDINYNVNYGNLIKSGQEDALLLSANGLVEIGVNANRFIKVSVVSTGATVNAKALVQIHFENSVQ